MPDATVYTLKVTLRHIDPPVWRRLRVPGACSLDAVHATLQIAFGWDESHLHAFTIKKQTYQPETVAYEEVVLEDVASARTKFVYHYDFGDDWLHDVVVEKVEEVDVEHPDANVPRCLDGQRAAPPEDSGGPHVYMQRMKRANVRQKRAAERFDRDEIDDRLRDAFTPRSKSAIDSAAVPTAPTAGPLAFSDEETETLANLLKERSSFDILGMMGVLHAVAVAPGLIEPSAWMRLVFPHGAGGHDVSVGQRRLAVVMRAYNDVVAAVEARWASVPPASELESCRTFARGFVAGAKLDTAWTRDKRAWQLAVPIAYLAGEMDLVPEKTRTALDALGSSAVADICAKLEDLVVGAYVVFLEERMAATEVGLDVEELPPPPPPPRRGKKG